MKIAFWSNAKHKSGVTASVALISVLWVELFMEEIAVTANHICNYSLFKRLDGGIEYEERAARKAYSYVFGEPEYFRMLYSGKIPSVLCLNDSLLFIPMEGMEAELFDTEKLKLPDSGVAERKFVMIDTACGCCLGSQRILEEAELTVVLFPPEKEYVDTFFQSGIRFTEHSFFILGNYRTTASYSPSYLMKEYHVPKERIGVIPYNFGFEQAMREGSVIAYITRNMNCSRRSSVYPFIRDAKKTVECLRNYAMNRRSVLCGDCGKV